MKRSGLRLDGGRQQLRWMTGEREKNLSFWFSRFPLPLVPSLSAPSARAASRLVCGRSVMLDQPYCGRPIVDRLCFSVIVSLRLLCVPSAFAFCSTIASPQSAWMVFGEEEQSWARPKGKGKWAGAHGERNREQKGGRANQVHSNRVELA